MRILLTVPFAAVLAACVTTEPTGGAPMPLINSAGQSIGTVRAWQTAGGVTFRIEARGLPHGVHGFHVHSVGRCDAPSFESAGPHWNPTNRKHGLNNPAGPHAGDLQNLTAAANGAIGETVTVSGATLLSPPGTPNALLDADGAALVIHAQADDHVTDPSGNSGGRIACAVIQPTPEVR
jgi:Cu-Zn family superoxide dismutase